MPLNFQLIDLNTIFCNLRLSGALKCGHELDFPTNAGWQLLPGDSSLSFSHTEDFRREVELSAFCSILVFLEYLPFQLIRQPCLAIKPSNYSISNIRCHFYLHLAKGSLNPGNNLFHSFLCALVLRFLKHQPFYLS